MHIPRPEPISPLARRLVSILVLLILTSRALAIEPQILFDDGWRFSRGDPSGADSPTFNDSSWTTVDLPHDWSIAGPIAAGNPTGSPGGFFPTGVGWYRKTFLAPTDWSTKQVAIIFDGAYLSTDVWLNGQKIGTHPTGFTPFSFNLTPHISFGSTNTIAVRVDNSRQPNSRWYSGSGIYRHVRLDIRNPLHISQFGIFISTESLTNNSAKLNLSITAENHSDQPNPNAPIHHPNFRTRLDGTPAAASVASFPSVSTDFPATDATHAKTSAVQSTATLPNPKLWTPETPNLYLAITIASSNGQIVDTRQTTFGVRTISASVDKGFLLNGQPLKMYGACVHDDNGPLGVAAFDRAETRRVELLKAAGFNAVRCAHNPPAPAFLDACDRLGLLVIDESFDSWTYGKLPQDYSVNFAANWQSDLDGMILRDRNHPSIVMWSLGNEIHDFGSPQGMTNGTKIVQRARPSIQPASHDRRLLVP